MGAMGMIPSMGSAEQWTGFSCYFDGMARPWEVSADDIVMWASSAAAAATFPKLIRRLLFATTPLRSIAMRADAGIRLAGWDGIVESFRSTQFCPPGLSYWELSVDAEVKPKLERDFQKRGKERTANPPATYVAVTARRFPEPTRGKWIQEKQRLSVFAGVAVLDADDLAAWIEQSPPVARWFAMLLGKPATGSEDLETFLALWEGQTAPRLPAGVTLAGREREASAERVRRWLSANAPRPFAIRGDTREEALVFAAAAIRGATYVESESWRSRALVVRDLETWRWVIGAHHAEPPILLPAFPEINRGHVEQAASLLKAHAVFPLDASAPIDIEAEVLEPIPTARIAGQLQRAGVMEADAERLARDSGGRLATLQILLGNVETPGWVVSADVPTLLVMLLAGAWDPTTEADREVIRRLGGDPSRLEELCAQLSRRPGAPIERETSWGRQGHWKWIAPAAAWKALARFLNDSHLASFRDVAIEVLGERDPRYEMPKGERFSAAIYGKVLDRSAALRAGIAETLVRLALSDRELRATLKASLGSVLAANVVTRILNEELGWQAWASLSGLLPVLAEAAPGAFLSQLERSLDRGEHGVSHLLLEEANFGPSPHTGLLWALEALSWNQEFVSRVGYALARLALRDPPENKMANRPANTLRNLLHPLIPQSQSSVEERVQILSVLLARRDMYGDVGWIVALGQCVGGPGFMLPSHRPQHRPWGAPVGWRDAPAEEVEAQRARTLELLLQHVGSEPRRWTALLDVLWRLAPAVAGRILDRLVQTMSVRLDVDGSVWASLRQLAARACQFGESCKLPPELVQRVIELYQSFKPADEIAQISWLFDNQTEVPEPLNDRQEQHARKFELQRSEVAKLLTVEERWELLAKLTSVAVVKFQVGFALGAIAEPELDGQIIESTRDERLEPLLPAFIWSRANSLGMEWAIERIKELVDGGRRDDALAVALVRAEAPVLWDMLDSMGESFKCEFWRNARWLFVPYSAIEADRALENLLHAQNAIVAAELASHHQDIIAPGRALEILRALRKLEEQRLESFLRDGGASYVIERVFSVADRAPALDVNEIASLELFFFHFLEDSSRRARYLFAALSRDPHLFALMVTLRYRAEAPTRHGAPGDEVELSPVAREPEPGGIDRRQRQREAAYTILSGWDGIPGADLAAADRETELRSWALAALQRTAEQERKTMGEEEVARVLARAPGAPEDGIWPCRAARELLESGCHGAFEDGFFTAKINLRGGTSRAIGEGGEQERVLATGFRTDAKKIRIQWPRTAALLDKLAERYDREGETEDAKALSDRRRWGEELTS